MAILKQLRKVEMYPFLQCPYCGATCFSIGTSEAKNDMGIYTCSKCKRKLRESEFREVEKPLVEFLCEKCLGYVPNVSEYRCNVDKDLLCSGCHRIVAYGPRPVHVSEVRRISAETVSRGQLVGTDLYLLEAGKKNEHAKLRYLNDLAQQEDTRLLSIQKKTRGYIVFSRDKLLGYLTWNRTENKIPTIRQLFVIPEMRRKGLGTVLVNHFVKKACFNRSNKYPLFLIESPNEASIELLTKLGYAGKISVLQSF